MAGTPIMNTTTTQDKKTKTKAKAKVVSTKKVESVNESEVVVEEKPSKKKPSAKKPASEVVIEDKKQSAISAVKETFSKAEYDVDSEVLVEEKPSKKKSSAKKPASEVVIEDKKQSAISAVKETFSKAEYDVDSEVLVEEKPSKKKPAAKKPAAKKTFAEDGTEDGAEGVEEVKPEKVKKVNLPGKYNKFMVFGYWLIENMKQNNVLDDTAAALQQLHLFSSVPEQVSMFESFFGDFKPIQKKMKNDIRVHNKPVKQKAPKKPAADKPKSKPGRKPKALEKLTDEQQELVNNIVNAANLSDVSRQISNEEEDCNKLDLKNPDDITHMEEDEEPEEADPEEADPEEADPEEEDEDEVEVSHFELNGKKYLIDTNNVLYDVDTFDQIGRLVDNKIVV